MQRLRVVVCAVVVASGLALTSCVKEEKVEIKVAPAQVTLGPGGRIDFDAIQSGTFGADVTWSIVEGPWVGDVTEEGTFTAADQVVPGQQITIRATSALYGNTYGEAKITVVLQVDPPAGPIGGGNYVRLQLTEPATDPDAIETVHFGDYTTTDIKVATENAILARAPASESVQYVDVVIEDQFGRTITYERGYKYRLNFLRLGGSAAIAAPDGIRSAAVGDFDGDGELEIVGGSDLGALGLVDNPSTAPTLTVEGGIVPGPIDIVRAGDVDGDGKDEILAGYYEFDGPPGPGGIEIVQYDDGELKDTPEAQFTVLDWNNAMGFEVGDVTGDGEADLVFLQNPPDTSSAAGALVVAPSADGSNLMTPDLAVIFDDTGVLPSSLAVADLDGDGMSEILVGYAGLGTASLAGSPLVEVLRWNGSDFVQVDNIPDPSQGGTGNFEESAFRLVVGDYDGDDIPDLLTFPINYQFLSDGRESFFAAGTGNAGDVLAPAQRIDALVSEPTSYLSANAVSLGNDNCQGGGTNGALSIYTCPGPAYESTAFIGGLFSTSSNASDLNGDGVDDLPMLVDLSGLGTVGDEGVMALINQGADAPTNVQFDLPDYTLLGGWFAPETVFRAFSPTRALTADLDGNGEDELIYPRWSYKPELGRFQILDTRAFEAQPAGRMEIGYPGNAFQGADFDGDGEADFVAIQANCPGCGGGNYNQLDLPGLSVQVFMSNGDGTYTPGPEMAIGDPAAPDELRDVAVADVDANGALDLLVAASTGIHVLPGGGDGSFGNPISVLPPTDGVRHMLVTDLDFDSVPDIVAVGSDTNIHVLRSTKNGGTLVDYPDNSVEEMALGGQGTDLAAADVDGDGDIDVIVAGGGATGLAVLRYDPKPDNPDYRIEEIDLSVRPSKLVAADLDADGRAEIVMSDEPAVVTVLHVLPGLGVDKVETIYTGLDDEENCPLFDPFPTPKTSSLALADMDLDGLQDLVVGYGAPECVWVQSDIAVLPGGRGGSFQSPTQYFAVDYPMQVSTGDYDGDGKTDVSLLILRNGSQIYNSTLESNIVVLPNTAD